jgi:hypothetical protein
MNSWEKEAEDIYNKGWNPDRTFPVGYMLYLILCCVWRIYRIVKSH